MDSSRTPPPARKGFTLVELLVVVVIIGMLVALTVPAIFSARGAARRARCVNNQKELSIALNAYASTKQGYPGYVNRVQDRTFSWAMVVLPYLGRDDIWVAWRDGHNTVVLIEQLVCAEDPVALMRDAPLSYVVNLNICRDRSSNVVSQRQANTVKMDDIRAPQRTPLVAERLHVGPWTSNTAANTNELGFDCWGKALNQQVYPSSNHAGGYIVAFVDGSVEFMPETTDWNQYQFGPDY